MKKRLTVHQYRLIDLVLWALILFVFEALAVLAAGHWFPQQPYTVSVVASVVAIVLLRWGAWGALHAVLGGAVLCAFSGAAPQQYAVYCLGNLLALLALPLAVSRAGEAIRSRALAAMAYGGAVQLLMQLGRALAAVALGASLSAATGFFTTDVISLLFTLVVLWIARRLDGVLEEQHHYLARVWREQDREEGGTR